MYQITFLWLNLVEQLVQIARLLHSLHICNGSHCNILTMIATVLHKICIFKLSEQFNREFSMWNSILFVS